ncbi:ABC transporter substrate-binding protein [Kutzneria viridogrisea]|uniref:Protein XP55 n=1 Tax=Kutzneria albida DSM 43870 TaxID=1449976 RepID=W5W1K7_9PSEU|nr:Protein XP55 [Kutzneria albida DSM 43870]
MLLAGAVAATACGTAPAAARDSVVIAVNPEPTTLNPVLGFAPYGASKLFDGLVALDDKLNLVPALAESLPKASEDNKTFTYTLRQGVTFSDGTPLTAEDVAFTYQSVLDPKTNTTMRTDFAAVESVRTPDPRTVVFQLKYPYATFPQYTGLGIVPAHLLRGKDINTDGFNRKPVGTGPYKLDSWQAGERMVLTANEKYWGGAPKVKKVTLAFVRDDNVRATRLATGELDAAAMPPRLVDRFRNQPGMSVRSVPSADYRGIMMPMGNPVTSDNALRRALDLVIDRDAMVKGILGGAGKPAFGPLFAESKWYEKSIEHPVDLPAAERILDEAGWVKGPDGMRRRGDTPARFTVMYNAADTVRKDIALAFSSDAKKVGVDVAVDGLSVEALQKRMDKDALVMGWGTPYDPDFITYKIFHSSFAGKGWYNPGRYHNPTVDKLLDEGRTTPDEATRVGIYKSFQKEQAADPAWLFCVQLDHVYVMADAWNGLQQQVEPHNDGLAHGPWWNVEKWVPKQ